MSESEQVQRFGRYRVHDVLGRGGFGTVYLGFDDELHRKVAIKVPHPDVVRSEPEIEAYMGEARIVAQLEHDGIASVYDVGRTEDGICYVVSRFIDGESLAEHLRSNSPSLGVAIQIVTEIADTLDFVHQQGVVHRDIKPGNILLSQEGRAFVTDFGLALRDHQLNSCHDVSGTPRYMSPEQARGESHLVDGRSDIFSLGILLYRMTTGQNPFGGADVTSVLDSIISSEPRLPREISPLIPHALQRVCLKALSKPINQRYARASLLAADLRQIELDSDSVHCVPSTIDETKLVLSGDQLSGVSPKGLRSFDVGDARFFNKLLPGPYDREGLPESLRFWKTLVEARNADETFRVGVIYGPSGSGKSSLVKAGLLPALDPDIDTILVEAAPDRTEQRLLTRLNSTSQTVTHSLHHCIQRLRHDGEPGRKTLIVIDQFEQWLHAVTEPNHSELANALRQCDGQNVQCILLVRDDFWLAVSRFMACLDIDLAQNQNMRLVDLFDSLHARRVLAEFGCGYGRLPENLGQLKEEENEFLDAAIEGLMQHDKIIPVRLALFAEMVKGKPWTLRTLQDIGGIEGVGPRFLEDCFESSTAPAEQRVHRAAVHRTLRALLPDQGTDIKGAMKSWSELLSASGYQEQPDQFRALIRILDSNLRLITPTDPIGLSPEDTSANSGMRFYQLTHDYLVPAIRERLTSAERSTRRGRAEVLLRSLSDSWNKYSDRRSLFGLFEWLQIQLLTNRSRWTESQRQMISAATGRILKATAVVVMAVSVAAFALYRYNGLSRADALVNQLLTSSVQEAPSVLSQMQSYQQWTVPRLKQLRNEVDPDSTARTFVSLALIATDPSEVDHLRTRVLQCTPLEQVLILNSLEDRRYELVPELWKTLKDGSADDRRRFMAALALTRFDSPGAENLEQWAASISFVTDQFVESATFNRQDYSTIVSAAAPIAEILAKPLGAIVAGESSEPVRREAAGQLLLDVLADHPRELTEQILNASPPNVRQAIPTLDPRRADVVDLLNHAVTIGYDDTLSTEEWVHRARRQATAAALLLRFRDSVHVWSVLRQSVRPDARSYLIDRTHKLGVEPALLIARLKKENDNGIRGALLLALGQYEFNVDLMPELLSAVDLAREWYVGDPDSYVHSASGWLLKTWKGLDYLRAIEIPMVDAGQGSWRRDPCGLIMVKLHPSGGDVSSFEIATTEVDCRLMKSVLAGYMYEKEFAPSEDCAAISVSWFQAVRFCQALTLKAGMDPAEQCYEEVEKPEEFRLKPDFLSLRGYRLPTQKEWEFALKGDCESEFDFGSDVSLVEDYEWVAALRNENYSRICGLKMPNRFGIFDLNGNVSEWCSDPGSWGARRPLRGASKGQLLESLNDNPTQTGEIAATIRFRSVGFRIVRSGMRRTD